MPEVTNSGTLATDLKVTGRAVITDLFPGGGPMRFTTCLEKLNNNEYQITHVTANPWGQAGGQIPLRREDAKRLRDLLNTIPL